MLFDFTPDIKLDPEEEKYYRAVRSLVYAFAAALGFSALYLFLFPSHDFSYNFRNADSPRNTLSAPLTEHGAAFENGIIVPNSPLFFYAAADNDFSQAVIRLFPDKKNSIKKDFSLSIARSFQAFMYPEGKPMEFRNGKLLKNGENYYIISEGAKRKFANPEIAKTLGYRLESFWEVNREDLTPNPQGTDIQNASEYPEGALFKIEENYYQLTKGRLAPFVSIQAYRSRYAENDALKATASLLEKYPEAEDELGFADGTLVSHAGGVYIVSGSEILPIGDPSSFEAMQFDWNDVRAVTEKEIGLYRRGKLFTPRQPHPDGTVFRDKDTDEYYIVDRGQKRKLAAETIQKAYLINHPITASSLALKEMNGCITEKTGFFETRFECAIAVNESKLLPGNAFRLVMETKEEAFLEQINLTLKRTPTWENLRFTLSKAKQRLIANFYGKQ